MWLAPYALPGEFVRVETVADKPSLARGRVVEVVEPSPDRVEAKCPHFTHCGGCHYQHASDTAQAGYKVAVLREVLERVGKVKPPEEIGVVTGPSWGYRNRVQLHFDESRMGFHAAGSNRDRKSTRLNSSHRT